MHRSSRFGGVGSQLGRGVSRDCRASASMVIYDLVERREQPAKQNTEQGIPYATKTDLKDVLDVVDDLKRQLNEMRLKTQNNAPEEVL